MSMTTIFPKISTELPNDKKSIDWMNERRVVYKTMRHPFKERTDKGENARRKDTPMTMLAAI